MNADRARALLLSLPHALETMQWGDNVVFWVGDKAIGGKMFALLPLDAAVGSGQPIFSVAVGPERYHALLEREGLVPAPYMARIFWVAALYWDALSSTEWQEHLRAAHALTLAKLPARTRAVLALPAKEQQRFVLERRKLLAEKAKQAATLKRTTAPRSRASPET